MFWEYLNVSANESKISALSKKFSTNAIFQYENTDAITFIIKGTFP